MAMRADPGNPPPSGNGSGGQSLPSWGTNTPKTGKVIPVVYGTQGVYGLAIYTWRATNTTADAIYGLCEAPATLLTAKRNVETAVQPDNLAALTSSGAAQAVMTDTATDFTGLGVSFNGITDETYKGLAQVRFHDLTYPSAETPEMLFGVKGRCVPEGETGAHPADVIVDLVTDPRFGAGLSTGQVDVEYGPDNLAASGCRRYCDAMGFRVNRVINEESNAADLLASLLEAINCGATWSAGKLRVFPYGDREITANGVTYTPPSTATVIDADEILTDGAGDAVTLEPVPDEQIFNAYPIEFPEFADYIGNLRVVETIDAGHVAQVGQVRRAPTRANYWIKDTAHASKISGILASRAIRTRNRYRFRLGPRWAALEPGDMIALTEPVFGLSNLQCRIMVIEEDERGVLDVQADEWPTGTAQPVDVTPQAFDGSASSVAYSYPLIAADIAGKADVDLGNVDTGSVTTDLCDAGVFQSSNYQGSGSGDSEYATRGAKIRQNASGAVPALLVDPAGIKIGQTVLSEAWFSAAKVIGLRIWYSSGWHSAGNETVSLSWDGGASTLLVTFTNLTGTVNYEWNLYPTIKEVTAGSQRPALRGVVNSSTGITAAKFTASLYDLSGNLLDWQGAYPSVELYVTAVAVKTSGSWWP